jgi:hypothetical protein
VLIAVKVVTKSEDRFLMPEIDKSVFKRGFAKYGCNMGYVRCVG